MVYNKDGEKSSMNNILYMKKHKKQMEEQPSRIREDFCHKSWRKSVITFWLYILAFGLLMAGLRYATACGDLPPPDETIKQIRTVPGL